MYLLWAAWASVSVTFCFHLVYWAKLCSNRHAKSENRPFVLAVLKLFLGRDATYFHQAVQHSVECPPFTAVFVFSNRHHSWSWALHFFVYICKWWTNVNFNITLIQYIHILSDTFTNVGVAMERLLMTSGQKVSILDIVDSSAPPFSCLCSSESKQTASTPFSNDSFNWNTRLICIELILCLQPCSALHILLCHRPLSTRRYRKRIKAVSYIQHF